MKQYEAVVTDKLGGIYMGNLNSEVFKIKCVNGKQKLHSQSETQFFKLGEFAK